ncbi:glycosyltransferase family 2 protein [Wenyingzhuangia sp. IMCC45533]
MKIALVILNWNGKELLKQFLPSIVNYSNGATIYVVDNASDDDSVEFLNKHYPQIQIISHPKNYGYAQGYNLALQQINADVYGLINSDVEVTEGWLTAIYDFYRLNTKASVVQPTILDFRNKDFFEYAGAAGGFLDKYGYAFCRGRIFNTIEKNSEQYSSTNITWASGACLFIKASDFKDLNGFDEDFFAHYEEIDLCWRAKNKGLAVNYLAESKVYHVGGATLKNSNPFKTYLNFRNSLFTLVKNLPKKQLFSVIFIRMILDGIAGFRFLFLGQPKHFISILKAHASFYAHFNKMYQKRSKHQVTDYYHQKSVVWSYFIKKQQTFNL